MTGWVKGQLSDREALVSQLKREEWNQLHFSASLRERKGFRLVQDGIVYILKGRERQPLRGSIYLTRGGALHSCFEPSGLRQEDIDRMGRIISERSLFSIIGRRDRVELLEELYGARESHVVDYDLMIREEPAVSKAKAGGLEIRPVGKDDFAELYPLEEAYQKEEVLRDPDNLNERFLKKRFHRQLGIHRIWAVYKGGRPIAKGGTNAIGFNFCQIGGVYTLPEERGKGIGLFLMDRIASELYREGWGTSLFVRKNNPAAQALYARCDYRITGDFRIVYPVNS